VISDREEKRDMLPKSLLIVFSLLFLGVFLSGCPKKIPEPMIIEKPSIRNPIGKLLETFSFAESFQAKASIRIDAVRNGEEMQFALNGSILFQKPDRLRILGYHPFGMGLFDALYKDGEFFLLIPPQKRAYTGEILRADDLIEKAGPIEVFSERPEGSEIPNRIRIEWVEKEIRITLRLREISVNPSLPEDSFQWVVPEGVKVEPLADLLRKKLKERSLD
jgi:hypothetical protein